MEDSARRPLTSRASHESHGVQLDVFFWDLEFAQAPVIARASGDERAATAFVRLRHLASGVEGWGEGCVDPYYGEIVESVAAVAPTLLAAAATATPAFGAKNHGALSRAAEEGIGRGADLLLSASRSMDAALAHNGAAKAAIESAMHELLSRAAGVSLTRWFGVDAPQTPTDFTLWIDAPERMAARAAAIQAGEIGYSALKLKVGLGGEEELLRSVRNAYRGPLRLDANCGWTLQRAMELLPFMERYGVELVEQPFPAGRLDEVSALASATEIPIVADEDCVVFDDIERVAGAYDGVNLKVVKIGGLGPLLRGLRRAEALGLRRMFGCMTETRLGIAGCAAISGATEFADLDGPIDLLNDPWEGLHLSREARWTHAPSAIGSGVTIDPGVAGFERS